MQIKPNNERSLSQPRENTLTRLFSVILIRAGHTLNPRIRGHDPNARSEEKHWKASENTLTCLFSVILIRAGHTLTKPENPRCAWS